VSSTTEPPVVLVTSRSFSSGDLDLAGELTAAGCRLVSGPPDHDLDALRDVLATAVAWIAGTGPVSADHLDAARRLRLVARYGVGVEAVDLVAAADRGIHVTNTPGANSGAVADHAVALMLAALRHVTAGDRAVRSGDWGVHRGRELGSLTVGIVGLGRIGRGVATRLRGFGTTLLGYDPYVDAEALELGIEGVELSGLAARADVITLHLPGEAVVVDAAFLDQLEPGAIVVNTARASLVDEAAVASALRADRLSGFAADVLGSEAGAIESPLLAPDLADRTVLTPHTAAQTVEAVDGMGRGSVDAVLAVLRDEHPPNLVSAPEGER
jgi:D-3-phosphoglycerate dehydrogenase / 2-oxoglutarate reductase